MTAAADQAVGLSAQQAAELLARALCAETHAAELQRENERLTRDIRHAQRTLGHETARCEALQSELNKSNGVAVRHTQSEAP